MASSFPAWCRHCCAVRTFVVRAVMGITERGDAGVRGRCVECGLYRNGLVKGEW